MKLFCFSALLLLVITGCSEKQVSSKKLLPSKNYHYTSIDTAQLAIKKMMYVPVYSHIYLNSGEGTFNLTSTLSVRNTSYRDSFYITDIIYYGSQGEVLRHYIDSALLLKPMASYEFVVEHGESEGGAGANFVVKWGARNSTTEPLIQAINCGSNTGVSFITQAVEIKN